MTGEAKPGEFLRIERIAEAVGVSQTPVREGLVELLPRRGFIVSPITAQDITDLYWVQAAISGELAARAAQLITDEQIAILEDNVRQYRRAASAEDWELTQELGSDFHGEVAVAAQSKRLALLLDQVTSSLPSRYMVWGVGNPRKTVREHPRLVNALKKRDSKLARSLMTTHMVEQGERLVEVLEERGLWSDQDAGKREPA
jgi:DNA-binding GntR family transcriptional regulator